MRNVAAALCAFGLLAAPSTSIAQAATGWSYAYANGVALASQSDAHGRPSVTIACSPPTGDIIISDYGFGRAARRVTTAAVKIGNLTVNIPAAVEGRGRNAFVTVHLPQRPPILAGLQPHDTLSVTVNNVTHNFSGDSAEQLQNVAYACWGNGN